MKFKKDNQKYHCVKKSKNSLRYTIWLYFMLFTFVIIVLLWLTQTVLLPINYQILKTRNIKTVAQTIIDNSTNSDFKDILARTAYDNNMCVLITDKYGNAVYRVDIMGEGSELNNPANAYVYNYRKKIVESTGGYIYLSVNNASLNTETLLFGMLIGTKEDPQGFIFLNTSLAPLTSTIRILDQQLVYITIMLIIIALIISAFVARRISKPITKITKSAEIMAQGNYNIEFDGYGYNESEKLAKTLNYASVEISKVDNLRKDLIANISHDLRTPLTMVKAYAEMIRDLSGDNKAKREEHLNVIIEESNRLAVLVNDILDLSKIESGNIQLNIESFEIKTKLKEVLERYTLLKEQKGYVFEYKEDEEAMVSGDILKIEQVLYNFINNAVNYTGEDKKIIIAQKNFENYVRIEVTDTGEGIESDKLPLIFDRYYRTEKSKREVIGTGLGLSIVKQILKRHNYPFGVQSVTGQGSTFWFEIKRAE